MLQLHCRARGRPDIVESAPRHLAAAAGRGG